MAYCKALLLLVVCINGAHSWMPLQVVPCAALLACSLFSYQCLRKLFFPHAAGVLIFRACKTLSEVMCPRLNQTYEYINIAPTQGFSTGVISPVATLRAANCGYAMERSKGGRQGVSMAEQSMGGVGRSRRNMIGAAV